MKSSSTFKLFLISESIHVVLINDIFSIYFPFTRLIFLKIFYLRKKVSFKNIKKISIESCLFFIWCWSRIDNIPFIVKIYWFFDNFTTFEPFPYLFITTWLISRMIIIISCYELRQTMIICLSCSRICFYPLIKK